MASRPWRWPWPFWRFEAGFRWNHPVDGAWSRRLTKREAEALPFPVVLVESEVPAILAHSA